MAVTNTFTDTVTTSYSGNGRAVSGKTGTYTGSKDAGVAVVVPANTTNQLITIAFPVAGIVSLVFSGSQNLTVKTNNSGSPINTLAVKANSDLIWANDYVGTNPLTADVTAFYVTNATSTDATFNFRVLYN
jgi:hypothetical protein